MVQRPAWNIIEKDLRVGLIVVADACRYLVGMDRRGDQAAGAILGLEQVPADHLDELIDNHAFLRSVKIAGTHFEFCAKRCFELVTELKPLEEVDVDSERAEGTEWLSYFLSFMPREAMGGLDFSGTFHSPDAPLQTLLGMAEARLALAEYVQGVILYGDMGVGFSPRDIAFLGDVDLRTVRNAMGPKGDKPIRSNALPGGRADYVLGDSLDGLQWLAGRRGFHQGRVSPEWVNIHLANIEVREAAAALPALIAWTNRTTTENLAASAGMRVDDLRAWTRGERLNRDHASRLAVAAGLDGSAYRALIDRLMK